MAKGRKKLPTKIKEMQGTLDVSREVENEMQVDLVKQIPEPPELLSKIGKKEWYKVALTHEALRNNWSKLGEMAHKNKPIEKRDCKQAGHVWVAIDDTANVCQFCKILDMDEKVTSAD